MENEKKTFITADLDLAAFLILHGIEYLDSEVDYDSSQRRPKVILKFSDSKQNARDLERVFLSSNEKKYRDILKYLLKEVHQKVNDFSKRALQED